MASLAPLKHGLSLVTDFRKYINLLHSIAVCEMLLSRIIKSPLGDECVLVSEDGECVSHRWTTFTGFIGGLVDWPTLTRLSSIFGD